MSSYSFPLDEALTYLKDLISIPSVSGEEQAIGIYLEDKLRGFGADQVSRIGSEDRFSVCAHITGSTPGPHILMTGHIDTVPPGDGWTCDPFTPLLRDGRIYGRGSNDMKGGISIILTVFHWACQHRGTAFWKAFGGFGSRRREILYWRAAGPPKRLLC